jgi:chromate transporter
VRTPLRDIALLFLRLGTTAFGGPAAHIAMMEDEVVRRRRWLSHEEFLDYLGATNLIPGPNSTELAIHIGHARAGWPGLIVAGACFILPASIIVSVIAWAYVRFGALPAVSGILYGVKPVVIAVVFQALWWLGHAAIKTRGLFALAAAAIVAAALGINELVILFGAGLVMIVARRMATVRRDQATHIGALVAGSMSVQAGAAAAAAPFGLLPLFGVFLKIGSVLFGSGYVLLAFLRSDFVERLHWLSERQLLDAVAVGQVTPGPVFTTATFIGYVLGGASGAAVATIGIFLPAFVFVALSGVLLPRIRHSTAARAALDGVNVASLALMAVVSAQLARAAIVDWITLASAVVAAVLLLRWRTNSAWLVLAGAVVGTLASAL